MIKLFLDTSLVDGAWSSFNLIADNYNITGELYYDVKSPCGITHKDEHCCSGRFNNPNICGNRHEIKQYCNYIKTTVKPPNVYCYAYDDSAGSLIIKHNYILITFWNTKYYSNKLILYYLKLFFVIFNNIYNSMVAGRPKKILNPLT